MASSTVVPPSIQSCAEMRTHVGLSCGQAARTASNTSIGKRSRLASEPPYWSVRWFDSGEMNVDSR